ncbi:SDR family NAD(P)-dependent oxidoreductase [Halobacteriales archaeon Cl-PHB]
MYGLDLSGRTAVVTGGTHGIGRAIAEALDEQGATVVPTSRTTESVEDAAAAVDTDLVCPTDVSSRSDVEGLFEAVAERYGGVDILVNSAGLFQHEMPPEEIDDEEWNRVVDVNLYGTFLTCQTVPQYMTGEDSAIVNVSSMAAERPLRGVTAYVATKAGINGMTRSLAVEYADQGIRVNAISPGYVKTRQNAEALETDSLREAIYRKTPLERYGDLEEVATSAVYLASPAAGFITGETLRIDGGFTIG